jgi:2-amino-4-hydroxy-6-hydroxymethyldihydropteridine diphosphokinase
VRALLGLGANLGDPVATLYEAKERLGYLGRVTAVSSLYRTPPWGVLEQPPFVNAALALETALDPDALLAALKALERDL